MNTDRTINNHKPDPDRQVVLVLGASGGIGREVVRLLGRDRHTVILAGRNHDKLEELSSTEGGIPYTLDGTRIEEVDACVEEMTVTLGRIDGVVNCIGSLLLKPAHRMTADEWLRVLETNLTSAFAAVRAGATALRERGGSIVLVSSAAAQIGLANHEAIAAAKSGVEGLTRSAAATYARRGIRVNCVAPGLTRTPLTASIVENDLVRKQSERLHALGRVGEPEEVARAILWFLDSNQSWVTGQILGVDGGLARVRTG